jgi:hypothetical protein
MQMKKTVARAAAIAMIAAGGLAVSAGSAVAGDSDGSPSGGIAPMGDNAGSPSGSIAPLNWEGSDK